MSPLIWTSLVKLLSQAPGCGKLNVGILCRVFDWQLSSLEQLCTLSLPPFAMLEDLYIYEYPYSQPEWKDNVETTLRMELLHPFTAVKNIYLPSNSRHLLCLPCKGPLGAQRQKRCPPYGILSWRSSSHRDSFRKGLGSSLLNNSSPGLAVYPTVMSSMFHLRFATRSGMAL
jgi:hypothetical protein